MRDGIPMVRITLEGMGQSLHNAIALHAESLKADAQHAVAQAIKSYPFEAELTRMAHEALKTQLENAIRDFFWREGRDAVNAAVAEVLAKAFAKTGGAR